MRASWTIARLPISKLPGHARLQVNKLAEGVLEKYQGVDVLVNCAGTYPERFDVLSGALRCAALDHAVPRCPVMLSPLPSQRLVQGWVCEHDVSRRGEGV